MKNQNSCDLEDKLSRLHCFEVTTPEEVLETLGFIEGQSSLAHNKVDGLYQLLIIDSLSQHLNSFSGSDACLEQRIFLNHLKQLIRSIQRNTECSCIITAWLSHFAPPGKDNEMIKCSYLQKKLWFSLSDYQFYLNKNTAASVI